MLPTYAEGLPIALLEGMAGGNALVSTRVGSIPDVVGEENGELIESGNTGALADALARLIRSPMRIEQMARRNRKLVESTYSWEQASERLTRLYERLSYEDAGSTEEPRSDDEPTQSGEKTLG